MSAPTFFFSYARQDDWSNYLSRFFYDLEERVAQWAGHALGDEFLGTIDIRIPVGEDWSSMLARALSDGSAFVMAETPLYYRREDCGKELRAFLRRSTELGIDDSGALTGARNIIRVRWLPEGAYSIPPDKRTRIPAILSRIEHTPPQDGRDKDRNDAIDRYVRKGMGSCVDVSPHYNELLNAFTEAIIRAAGTLPPGAPINFDNEDNAFELDWRGYLQPPPQNTPPPPPPPDPSSVQIAVPLPAREPEGLKSVVAFHITLRSFATSDHAISFADRLIGESAGDAPPDPWLGAILAELRNAALEENLDLFNVAPAPPLPFDVPRLAAQLQALMERGVVTLLVLDPQWLLAVPPGTGAGLLRQLLDAIPGWCGAVIIAADQSTAAQALVPADGPYAVPGAVVLPLDSRIRAFDFRRILVETRGRAMRSLGARAGDGQTLPLLSGTRSKAA
ncbi:MAG: hypothetical protein ACJ8EB_06550 [Allosphingosinicella sp.]